MKMTRSTEISEPKEQREPIAVKTCPSAQESEKFNEPEEAVSVNLISAEQAPQREVPCKEAYRKVQEREGEKCQTERAQESSQYRRSGPVATKGGVTI